MEHWNDHMQTLPQLHQYQYYSTGLLSNYDKYPEHSKSIVGHKKKMAKEQKKQEKKAKGTFVFYALCM